MKKTLLAATAVIALGVAGPAFAQGGQSYGGLGEVSWEGAGVQVHSDADLGAGSVATGDLTGAWSNGVVGTTAHGSVSEKTVYVPDGFLGLFGDYETVTDVDALGTATYSGSNGAAALGFGFDAGHEASDHEQIFGEAVLAGDANVEVDEINNASGMGAKPNGHFSTVNDEGVTSGAHGLFAGAANGSTGKGVTVSTLFGATHSDVNGAAGTGYDNRAPLEHASANNTTVVGGTNKTAGLDYSTSSLALEANSNAAATLFGNEAH